MKMIRLLAIVCLALPLLAAAQGLSASKCFTEAPDAVIPLIDKNTRLDMVDYFMAGMSKASTNKLMGSSSIVEMNDSSVLLNLTDSVRCQIFVLNPNAPAPIIGVITTYSGPMPDSSVDFYTTRWQKLSGIMPKARLSDWLTAEGAKNRALVEEQLPFILASYAYDPASQTIVATNNTGHYFSKDDAPAALGMLKGQLAYRWEGNKFKLTSK